MRKDSLSRLLLVAAAVTSVVFIGILWPMQRLGRVCIAIYPPPPGCGADEPRWVPLVGIGVILTLLTAAVIVYFTTMESRRVAVLSVLGVAILVAFVLCAIVVALSQAGVFDPGYPIDLLPVPID